MFGIQIEKFQFFFFFDFRKKLVIPVAIFFFVVFAFRINNGESGEFHDLSLRAEDAIGARYINGGLIKNRRIHLAGDKTVPDELIELELFGGSDIV